MKKMYVVRNYGQCVFVTDSKEDALELAKAIGALEEHLDRWVEEAIYIEGEGEGRDA